jgi:hypothetical protein
MPANRTFHHAWFLSASVALVMLASGCCGPMACGPMGCGGPIAFGGRACGDGCNGCGERYIDEWINHPPSCSDPCDGCGNYNGQTCHACRPILSGFPSLWGYRCDPPPVGCDRVQCEPSCGISSCDSGCSSCGGGGHIPGGYHPMPMEPEEIHYGGPVRLQPHQYETHAPSIVRSPPSVRAVPPQRTRQIFRPRPSVAAGHPQSGSF